MNKPNIFTYATSELSHDAFIAWLMSWADPIYEGQALHNLSYNLLKECFHQANQTKPDILKVEVNRQHHKIDVFIRVTTQDNSIWGIIIENKIYSKQHSEQLSRYREHIAKIENITEDQILGIYYKMWEQSNMKEVYANGYFHLDRKRMLSLFERHIKTVKNDIVHNYYQYIKSMQEDLDAFKTTEVKHWGKEQWVGFYSQLKKELSVIEDYGNVNNASSPFWGCWFGIQKTVGNNTLYVQSEQNKLCFKIYTANQEDYEKAKWYWHKKVIETAENYKLKVVKPSVMRKGETSSIGILKTDEKDCWMVTDEFGVIDYEQTKELVLETVEIVKEAASGKDYK